jgi:hypothetical protein
MRTVSLTVLVAAFFLLQSAHASAQNYPPPPPPPYGGTAAGGPPPLPPAPEPVAEKKLGVGYKIGNGLGFLGADVIIAPIEHLAFDLQINYFSASEPEGTAKGVGYAPSVQGRLNGGQKSTPYLGVGFAHISLSLNNVTASGNSVFGNIGYEWRWDSGLGILLGGGIQHIGTISATDGTTTITEKGGTFFNLEAGLRYMFL